MNNKEKGRVICKEFTIGRQAIRQDVCINQEKRGPKMDPCGSPEVIPFQEEF